MTARSEHDPPVIYDGTHDDWDDTPYWLEHPKFDRWAWRVLILGCVVLAGHLIWAAAR